MVAKLSEGAEALIYSGRVLGFDAVIKDRVRKGYRIRNIDERIRAARTRSEARILSQAADSGVSVPRILFVDKYSICMTRIEGRNLNAVPERKGMRSIYRKLGACAGMLHNADIAHGDYTPANVMIDGEGDPWIIDFGLAELTVSDEDKALDILLMKRSIGAGMFRAFAGGYRASGRNADGVLKRLASIEKRGRYQTRTLMSDEVQGR